MIAIGSAGFPSLLYGCYRCVFTYLCEGKEKTSAHSFPMVKHCYNHGTRFIVHHDVSRKICVVEESVICANDGKVGLYAAV